MQAIIAILTLFICHFGRCVYVDVGTTLFHKSDAAKKCWTTTEKDLLVTRKLMEEYLPDPDLLDLANPETVPTLLEFFRTIFHVARETSYGEQQRHVLKALADAVGGYLRVIVLPAARAAYYSGILSYDNTRLIFALYEDLKAFLHAPRNSWRTPGGGLLHARFSVLPLEVSNVADQSACDYLLIEEPQGVHQRTRQPASLTMKKRVRQSGMGWSLPKNDSEEPELGMGPITSKTPPVQSPSAIIPLPMLDNDERPKAIALPWKEAPLLSLSSNESSYIIAKYYVNAIKCINGKSDSREDLIHFNTELYNWISTKVMPHLEDEHWYVGFGGVLRVMETIKSMGIDKTDDSTETQDGHYIFGGSGVEIGNQPHRENDKWTFEQWQGPTDSWGSRTQHFMKEAFGSISRFSGNSQSHIILLITFLLLLLSVCLLCCCCAWCKKHKIYNKESTKKVFSSLSQTILEAVRKNKSKLDTTADSRSKINESNDRTRPKMNFSRGSTAGQPKIQKSNSPEFQLPSSNSQGPRLQNQLGTTKIRSSELRKPASGGDTHYNSFSNSINPTPFTQILSLTTPSISEWGDGKKHANQFASNRKKPLASGDGWLEIHCPPASNLDMGSYVPRQHHKPMAFGDGWSEIDCKIPPNRSLASVQKSNLTEVSKTSSSFYKFDRESSMSDT